jgi:hypothetical protein
VGILGSTRLARVVVAYALERRGARVVSLDPGDEDEGLPWFAPIRGLARDNGLALGRADAAGQKKPTGQSAVVGVVPGLGAQK